MNILGMSGLSENGLTRAWWKEAVIYQIYPRSFMDSNGDGVGDLPGIISKLDYLRDLGVTLLWLSPIFPSPNADNGYDISDYCDIAPEFGSLADFDTLVAEAGARGMRIVLDLVLNHSSDEHPWFKAARQSKANPYRDYYLWHPPVNGGPPNDWPSFFSGSAWSFDAGSGEYYLHLFASKQPDLNWANPRVRDAMKDVMRFWLERGVGGFRVDAFPFISKPSLTRAFSGTLDNFYASGPELHAYLHELHRDVLTHYDAITAGEAPGVTPANAGLFVARVREEFDMLFHFDHLKLDRDPANRWRSRPYTLAEFKAVFARWDAAVAREGWNTVYLGNHDSARLLSHFGDDGEYREASAKLFATLLLTQRGTPVLYQGDELGMSNANFCDLAEYRDIETLNAHREWVLEKGMDEAEFLAGLGRFSRDHARTPMQWRASPQAGFSAALPWIAVNGNYPRVNAEAQQQCSESVLAYYRAMLGLRRSRPLWVYGDYTDLLPEHGQLFVYRRQLGREWGVVLLNMSGDVATLPKVPVFEEGNGVLVMSNLGLLPGQPLAALNQLAPWEARVYACA